MNRNVVIQLMLLVLGLSVGCSGQAPIITGMEIGATGGNKVTLKISVDPNSPYEEAKLWPEYSKDGVVWIHGAPPQIVGPGKTGSRSFTMKLPGGVSRIRAHAENRWDEDILDRGNKVTVEDKINIALMGQDFYGFLEAFRDNEYTGRIHSDDNVMLPSGSYFFIAVPYTGLAYTLADNTGANVFNIAAGEQFSIEQIIVRDAEGTATAKIQEQDCYTPDLKPPSDDTTGRWPMTLEVTGSIDDIAEPGDKITVNYDWSVNGNKLTLTDALDNTVHHGTVDGPIVYAYENASGYDYSSGIYISRYFKFYGSIDPDGNFSGRLEKSSSAGNDNEQLYYHHISGIITGRRQE